MVYKDDFVVLTGNFTAVAQSNEDLYYMQNISYPSGYNKDNCIVLALGLKTVGGDVDRGYSFGTSNTTTDHRALLAASIGKSVRLANDNIVITTAFNYGGGTHDTLSYNFAYKLVLIKTN